MNGVMLLAVLLYEYCLHQCIKCYLDTLIHRYRLRQQPYACVVYRLCLLSTPWYYPESQHLSLPRLLRLSSSSTLWHTPLLRTARISYHRYETHRVFHILEATLALARKLTYRSLQAFIPTAVHTLTPVGLVVTSLSVNIISDW